MYGWCSNWRGFQPCNVCFPGTRNRCWETRCTLNLDFKLFAYSQYKCSFDRLKVLHILQRHATTSTSGPGDPNLKRMQRILWPSWSFHFPHLRSELHGSFPQWLRGGASVNAQVRSSGESFPSPPTAQHGVESNTREVWKLSVFGNYLNFINFHQSSAHPQSPKPVKT